MTNLSQSVKTVFIEQLGYMSSHILQAPGRVNLIGEHTDYNDGFVLPCAIDYMTVVAAAKRSDKLVRVVAVDYQNAQDQFSLDEKITFVEAQDKMWANYIRGVVSVLLADGARLSGV
ncbi:MAG: galactokinase family protein, partial [Vibrionaceae bacterium]